MQGSRFFDETADLAGLVELVDFRGRRCGRRPGGSRGRALVSAEVQRIFVQERPGP